MLLGLLISAMCCTQACASLGSNLIHQEDVEAINTVQMQMPFSWIPLISIPLWLAEASITLFHLSLLEGEANLGFCVSEFWHRFMGEHLNGT